MRKLTSFTFITINGFYKGHGNDISWHGHGEEESRFSEDQLMAGNILLFGRITYEMMSGFWQSESATEMFSVVSARMNEAEKIVFSKKLNSINWINSNVIGSNIAGRIAEIKKTKGKDLTILGSGSIVEQFSAAGLPISAQCIVVVSRMLSGRRH